MWKKNTSNVFRKEKKEGYIKWDNAYVLMKVRKGVMKWKKVDCMVLESLTNKVHEYV